MSEKKIEKLEREYIIPLRPHYQHVPRYKKTPKAIKTIKEFLVRHMQIRDRDLNKIKINRYLNELMWLDGIKNPPHKIKVRAIKEGEIVKVEAVELPGVLDFKKKREEKVSKKAEEEANKKKIKKEENTDDKKNFQEKNSLEFSTSQEKINSVENKKIEDEKKESEKENKEKFEEKKEATIEGMEKIEKQEHKKSKHLVGGRDKNPKHQFRQALAK